MHAIPRKAIPIYRLDDALGQTGLHHAQGITHTTAPLPFELKLDGSVVIALDLMACFPLNRVLRTWLIITSPLEHAAPPYAGRAAREYITLRAWIVAVVCAAGE